MTMTTYKIHSFLTLAGTFKRGNSVDDSCNSIFITTTEVQSAYNYVCHYNSFGCKNQIRRLKVKWRSFLASNKKFCFSIHKKRQTHAYVMASTQPSVKVVRIQLHNFYCHFPGSHCNKTFISLLTPC